MVLQTLSLKLSAASCGEWFAGGFHIARPLSEVYGFSKRKTRFLSRLHFP
jgi:hypothetical protein